MSKATPLSLAELNTLMQRLQATLDILVGGGGGTRARSSSTTASSAGSVKSAAKGSDGRRDRNVGKELQVKLGETLKSAKGGLSLGELADKVGGSKETIGYHLRVLRDGKKAKVVGTRGTARWHSL